MMLRFRILIISGLALLLAAGVTAWARPPQSATAISVKSLPTPNATPAGVSNEACLACHNNPELTMALANGDTLNLHVAPEEFNRSIHGSKGYACVQCHTNLREYPHPKFTAQDRRDATLQLYTACKTCHLGQYQSTQDSMHQKALAAGKREAAVCTDCHTAHATQQLTNPATHALLPTAHTWIPKTCAQCHNAIYQKYLTSVHGAALTDENNQDVPTCINCHGVHRIPDPTTDTFRLKSPEMCAKCHTDPARMQKYNISTDVLNTYVADFHGTTVTLFEQTAPDAPTNKPVCYDCHGVHDIQRVDDPKKGLLIRENLLKRCQVCHPDATANFPDAWLSHYIPSPEKNPLVYYVNLFYQLFIPAVLGGMGVLVVLDASWRIRTRLAKRRALHQPQLLEQHPAPEPPVAAPPVETRTVPETLPPETTLESEPSPSVPEPLPSEAAPATDETGKEILHD